MKVFNKRGESIEIGDNDIVPDGFGVHCPAFLMDGIQREIATSRVRIIDAAGRPSGNRPGFCFATDANDDNERAARIAYDASVKAAEQAWRSPPNHNTTAAPAVVTASRKLDVRDAQALRDQAYEDMCKRVENSWRSPNTNSATVTNDQTTAPDDDVENAREAYKKKISEAWRSTKGVGFGPGSFGV